MAGTQPWRFTQLGGNKTVLVLDGPNAPYGRPRKAPVVEPEIEVRETEVYYPGNDIPTRHIFGTRQSPISLSGRFMDSRIGQAGGAQFKADEVQRFVRAKIPCRIEWGGFVAMTGLITRFKRSIESGAEIAWSMTVKIDSDDTQANIFSPTPPNDSASQLLAQVQASLLSLNSSLPDIPDDIEFTPGLLGGIKSLISTINSVMSVPLQFAQSVDNFESALNSDVAQFEAGIHQVSNACDQLQITLSTGENDLAIAGANATSQAKWFSMRAETDVLLLAVLDLLARGDLAAERARKGTPDKTVRASGGDTWESLASANLGSSGKADDLRQANGARYGSQPTPGQAVHIPKAA